MVDIPEIPGSVSVGTKWKLTTAVAVIVTITMFVMQTKTSQNDLERALSEERTARVEAVTQASLRQQSVDAQLASLAQARQADLITITEMKTDIRYIRDSLAKTSSTK